MAPMTIPSPAYDLRRAVRRTLWILFGGFCLAACSYVALFLVLSLTHPGGLGLLNPLPTNWDQWRFFFGALAVAMVYASFRLRMSRLDPARLVRRARERAEARGRETPSRTNGSQAEAREARLLQDLVGQWITGHVMVWSLAEVPAILGVILLVLSGDGRYFLGMVAVSAIALFAHRPRDGRWAEILADYHGAGDRAGESGTAQG